MSAASIALGEIMAKRSGSVDPSNFPEEVFDLYSIPAFDLGRPEVVPGNSIGSAKPIVQPNDVLLSRIVPHIRRSWVVGKDRGRRIIASGEWIVFRSERVHPDYLRHVLVSDPFHSQLMNTVSGVGGSLLRARPEHVGKIKILCHRWKSSGGLRMCWTRRRLSGPSAALAQLDTLTQSIFLDLFGDPATNPKDWPRKALGELSIKFSDGPFGSNLKTSHYVESGIRVVRLQNIGVGEFVDSDRAYISEIHFGDLKKHECRPGDVLVATLGDPNLRACIQPEWLPVALNKADCVQIRPDSGVSNSSYICALLNQPSTERLAQDLILGQTRLRISMGRLRGLRVPTPPVAVQNTFLSRISGLEKLKSAHRSSLTELDSLFATLQHRAFRGTL